MRPKNAPLVIYWVEVQYPNKRTGLPMGGKFTRKDMAIKRASMVRQAGGEATIYRSQMLDWLPVPHIEEGV